MSAPLSKEESLARFLTFARAILRDARAICANPEADPEHQERAFLVLESMKELSLLAPDFLDEDASAEPFSKRSVFFVGYWAGSLDLGGGVVSDHPKRVKRLKARASGKIGGEVRRAGAELWLPYAEVEIIAAWESDKFRTNEELRDKAIANLRAKKLPSRGPDAVLRVVKKLRRDKKIPKAKKPGKP